MQSHQFLLDVRTELNVREYLLFPKMKKKKKPLDQNDSLRSTMDRINNNITNPQSVSSVVVVCVSSSQEYRSCLQFSSSSAGRWHKSALSPESKSFERGVAKVHECWAPIVISEWCICSVHPGVKGPKKLRSQKLGSPLMKDAFLGSILLDIVMCVVALKRQMLNCS
jgi:hypothetical protein